MTQLSGFDDMKMKIGLPDDMKRIFTEFYALCPRYRQKDQGARLDWSRFFYGGTYARIQVGMAVHIMEKARARVSIFVDEELKSAVREGATGLWKWVVEAAARIVEIPETVKVDPNKNAPHHFKCVENIWECMTELMKLSERKTGNDASSSSSSSSSTTFSSSPELWEDGDEGDPTTSILEGAEALTRVAISIAFKKSLDILRNFELPLSDYSKDRLIPNMPYLLPPGTLWVDGSDEIKAAVDEVIKLMKDSGSVPSEKLNTACEYLSSLCLAWRLDDQGGIECTSILTEDGQGGHHGVGLIELMKATGYQELLVRTTQEMKEKLKADVLVGLNMSALYPSQDSSWNSDMNTVLISGGCVIGGLFKVSQALEMFSTLNADGARRFIMGLQKWAEQNKMTNFELFDKDVHMLNQEGFPTVKEGTKVMKITQLVKFLDHVVDKGVANDLCRLFTRVRYRLGEAASNNSTEAVFQCLQSIKESHDATGSLGEQYRFCDAIFQGLTVKMMRDTNKGDHVEVEVHKRLLQRLSISLSFTKAGTSLEGTPKQQTEWYE